MYYLRCPCPRFPLNKFTIFGSIRTEDKYLFNGLPAGLVEHGRSHDDYEMKLKVWRV